MDGPGESQESLSREVYAQVGLAIYFAQCFEQEMENVLLLKMKANGTLKGKEGYSVVQSALERYTMGRLLKLLKEAVEFSSDGEEILATALANTNVLAHSFFKAHAETWYHPNGKERMIQELQDMQDSFRIADFLLRPASKLLLKILGIDSAVVEDELQRLKNP